MNAVDTNVLLYSVDRNEPAKQFKAQQLLQQLRSAVEPTILLWQVLGELTQQLRRWRDQGRLTPAEYSLHLRAFRHLFPLALPTHDVFGAALDLSSASASRIGTACSSALAAPQARHACTPKIWAHREQSTGSNWSIRLPESRSPARCYQVKPSSNAAHGYTTVPYGQG